MKEASYSKAKGIHFKGYLTYDDSVKVQQAVRGRRLVPTHFIITVVTLAIVAFLLAQMSVGKWLAILLLAFLGALMAGGLWFINTSARKSKEAIYRKACVKRHGILNADDIRIKKGQTRQTIPWDMFERVIEVEDIVAIVRGGESLGFARYMFNTKGEWSRARELIKNRYR